jgi:hypothetical protein
VDRGRESRRLPPIYRSLRSRSVSIQSPSVGSWRSTSPALRRFRSSFDSARMYASASREPQVPIRAWKRGDLSAVIGSMSCRSRWVCRREPLRVLRRIRPIRRSSLRIIPFGGPFSQLFRVAKIFSAAGLLFVAKQCGTANEVRSDPFQRRFAAFRPRFFEADSGDRGQQIYPVGLHSQLDHPTGRAEIRRLDPRFVEAEFRQCAHDALRILFSGPHQ